MYSKDIIDKFINKISSTFNIAENDLNSLFNNLNKENSSSFKENLFEKKIDELRDICEMCGNIRTGNKKDLIHRIQTTENPYTPLYLKGTTSLKDMCRKYKLKCTGNKNVLVLRLFKYLNDNEINYNDKTTNENIQQIEDDDNIVDNYIQNLCCNEKINYKSLKKSQLKNICLQKGLDQTGSRLELIQRLENN
tara:strand:+ start:205 stop:783 length:579 start_codon:yes stop_codon:yes gene_type:complete